MVPAAECEGCGDGEEGRNLALQWIPVVAQTRRCSLDSCEEADHC
jgi:hypothetical protein